MKREATIVLLVAIFLPWLAYSAEDIRFEVPVLPDFQRYLFLLEEPGIMAVALENNGLSPSLSSKLKVHEDGRKLEIRNAVLRYSGRKGTVFTYEAVYMIGLRDTKLS